VVILYNARDSKYVGNTIATYARRYICEFA
jgi:hypothetical protein